MAKRYTAEEEAIIAEEISKSPDNIKRGCYNASIRIERNVDSVIQHWYRVQSKKENSNALFLTIGKKSYIVNRKISHDGCNKLTKIKLLSKYFFRELLKKLGLN